MSYSRISIHPRRGDEAVFLFRDVRYMGVNPKK